MAERIRAGVAELDLGGADHAITVSIGTAAFPADSTVVEELVDTSDWAMYLAKRQGRARMVPFRSGTADAARTPRSDD